MPLLSLLTVTKAEPHAHYFIDQMANLATRLGAELVIGVDGHGGHSLVDIFHKYPCVNHYQVFSQGYLESVHDDVLAQCRGRYVLRLDDDEAASFAMEEWLLSNAFITHPHWKFARAALWGDTDTYITNPPLWQDHQTRLSVKEMANGRNHIHAGSPYGGGELAPCAIEHHKFLVKTYEQRLEIANRYDVIQWGAGLNGMAAFQLPEDVFGEAIQTAPLDNGYVSV